MRALIAAAFLFLLGIVFVGCGSSDSVETPTTFDPPPETAPEGLSPPPPPKTPNAP
jgi:hypothetical protein